MKFIIKHHSTSRVRLELPLHAVRIRFKMYLEELACTVPVALKNFAPLQRFKHVGVILLKGKFNKF